jgi:hypothetical protein
MGLNIGESGAANTVVNHLTGNWWNGHAPPTRKEAVAALVLLCTGANKSLGAGHSAKTARELLEQHWPDLTAETWTDSETHADYDLTVEYRDAHGDPWVCVGWLTPFDGVPVPYMECRGTAVDIETVIREFGPLTVDAEDGA